MSEINQNIQKFYDASTKLWEETWGEHMHHGYYGPDGTAEKDHHQAQVDLIEEFLRWGHVTSPQKILDVGCGVGGSSLYLANKFGAEVAGITLSPVQVSRANTRAIESGMDKIAHFSVADAMNPPFPDESFDLVWSLESGEHMPDKKRFLQTYFDLLKPGGTFLMATWCHRAAPPELTVDERNTLEKIYRAYHLPYIIDIPMYEKLAQQAGFHEIESADWTEAVAPFWQAVVRSVFSVKSISGLAQAGLTTIRGAIAMSLMISGYRSGLIRFGLLQGKKRA